MDKGELAPHLEERRGSTETLAPSHRASSYQIRNSHRRAAPWAQDLTPISERPT